MPDQVAPVAAPAQAPVTADELTKAAVDSIKDLGPLEAQVRSVMDFYVAYPPEDKPDPAEVAQELPVTVNQTSDQIVADASAVQKALDAEKDTLTQMFVQMTGNTSFTTADLAAFQAEYEREKREQAANAEIVGGVIRDVTELCGKLGQQNPDPALKPAKKESALDHARVALSMTFTKGLATLSKEYSAGEQTVKPYYSWQSSITLKAEHSSVLRLNILKKMTAGVNDLALLEPKLKSKRLGADDRAALFAELMQLARADQEVIAQIVVNVTQEFELVKDGVNAVARVENYTKYVLGFFPTSGKIKAKK